MYIYNINGSPFISSFSSLQLHCKQLFSTRLFSAGFVLVIALVSALPSDGDFAPKNKRSFVERDGVNLTVFEHAATGAKMQFVTN